MPTDVQNRANGPCVSPDGAVIGRDFAIPDVDPTNSRPARADLRRQIGHLERELAGLVAEAFPRLQIDTGAPANAEPRLLDLAELEAVRDSLAARVVEARRALKARAELEARNRELLERLLAEPAKFKWVQVSRADIGEPGCGHWHSLPRFSLLGMLMGWWRVKVSSGCPLPSYAQREMAEALPMAQAESRVELDEHYPRVHRYVHGLLRDPSEAEDLTQETFLRAHRSLESLRDPAAAVPWLYNIATHVCLDRLRQRARREPRESQLEPEAASPPDPAPAAQLRVEQEEMSTCVQAYVAELSDSYRAVLLLHDAHGLTCPQIAELLGDTPGSVKVRLHRARKRLQSALETGCAFSHDERGTLVCEPRD